MTKHEAAVVEQNTTKRRGVGLRALNPERASPGFTLFSALIWGEGRVYLVDLRGDVVHTWNMPYPPAYPAISPSAERCSTTGALQRRTWSSEHCVTAPRRSRGPRLRPVRESMVHESQAVNTSHGAHVFDLEGGLR